ncbi:IS66 family insertion sequence element accessory protein TnpB [Rhizobium sp. ZPR3]|uniref:IS66 family insertion sequence element accessory protein TnpB n=2 Tax=unclassified Rhizobium TaxID=2613769 RepID=A0AAU7SS50_9HYPH
MIGPSGNVRVYLACGVTDMRRGIDGLSALVETVVKEAPGSGAIFGTVSGARLSGNRCKATTINIELGHKASSLPSASICSTTTTDYDRG